MGMTIRIEIQGLAILYRQGNLWQIVFICDDWHRVNFTHRRNGEVLTSNQGLRKNGKDRSVDFDFDNVNNPTPNPLGQDFYKILNLAGIDLHGTEPGGKKSKLKRKRSGSTDLVFMLLPSFAMSTFSLTDHPYYVAPDLPGSTPTPVGKVAKIAGAEILLNPGSGASMLFHDGDGDTRFPYTENDLHILNFNNDCGDNCGSNKNDFLLFYDWIKDSVDENRRFIAGKVPSENAVIEKLTSPNQGNCDPIVIEPPPA